MIAVGSDSNTKAIVFGPIFPSIVAPTVRCKAFDGLRIPELTAQSNTEKSTPEGKSSALTRVPAIYLGIQHNYLLP